MTRRFDILLPDSAPVHDPWCWRDDWHAPVNRRSRCSRSSSVLTRSRVQRSLSPLRAITGAVDHRKSLIFATRGALTCCTCVTCCVCR